MNCSSMKNLQNWTFLSSTNYGVFSSILLTQWLPAFEYIPPTARVDQSRCTINNSTEHNPLHESAIH